jgi:hypothetical protein
MMQEEEDDAATKDTIIRKMLQYVIFAMTTAVSAVL